MKKLQSCKSQPQHLKEEWKWAIFYYNGRKIMFDGLYRISNRGRVKRVARWAVIGFGYGILKARILTVRLNWAGYPSVQLHKNKERFFIPIHKLVLHTFVGPCPPGKECCHRDDNRWNNRLANLRYGTHESNIREAFRNGKRVIKRGENHYLSRMSNKEVEIIRKMWVTTKRKYGLQSKLARRFGVTPSCIWYLVHNINRIGEKNED
jgi:hypothetical protein